MRYIIPALIFVIYLSACNNQQSASTTPATQVAEEKANFFPVTSFIKGELFKIKQEQIVPIKKIIINSKIDTVLVAADQLNNAFAEFLTPVIDSANLVHLFTESKFNDQTLNAYTLTYELKKNVPDTMELKHWDVYINPETGSVSKIYIAKSRKDSLLYLNWVAGDSCVIKTVINNPAGKAVVAREETLKWKF